MGELGRLVASRCNCGGFFSGNHKDDCAGIVAPEEELVEAWRAAEKVWQADPFNGEKEQDATRAADALRNWRRFNTPEGRAYAESPKTYKDGEVEEGDD